MGFSWVYHWVTLCGSLLDMKSNFKLRQGCAPLKALWGKLHEGSSIPWLVDSLTQALLLWTYCLLLFCVSQDPSASFLGPYSKPLDRIEKLFFSRSLIQLYLLIHKVLFVDLGNQNVDIAFWLPPQLNTTKHGNKWQKSNLHILADKINAKQIVSLDLTPLSAKLFKPTEENPLSLVYIRILNIIKTHNSQ